MKRQILILALACLWTVPIAANAAPTSKPSPEKRCSRCHGDPPNRVCLPMICPDDPIANGAQYHSPVGIRIGVADMKPCVVDGKAGRCFYEPK